VGKAFLIDAMNVLLGLTNLIEPERAMLLHLRAAAGDETYWDAVSRNAHNPFGRAIPINIMFKGHAAGFGSVLEQLKEKHANVQDVAHSQGNASASVSGTQVVA
jgi:hypothetical protein